MRRAGGETRTTLHAVRTDGLIVKPDTRSCRSTAMYTQARVPPPRPMIASAHTDHWRFAHRYVFSYGRAFDC